MNAVAPLLQIRHLTTEFQVAGRVVRPVNDVSFDLYPGETLAVVGESGSGKSMTILSMLRLLPKLPGLRISGQVWFNGMDLLAAAPRAIRAVRGAGIGVIFQDPMSSLNPVLSVGDQICEALRLHDRALRGRGARERATQLLSRVNIADPARILDEYPHRLSGVCASG